MLVPILILPTGAHGHAHRDALRSWAHLDSNQGPGGYEPPALTAELWAQPCSTNTQGSKKNESTLGAATWRADRRRCRPCIRRASDGAVPVMGHPHLPPSL